MAFKFVIISCLVALVRAGNIPAAVVAETVVAAPAVAGPAVAARLEEFDTFPQYRFGYNVADTITGDVKTQFEERNGDLVRGQYTLIDSDSTRRIVDYFADAVNGFNAVVRKEPLVAAPAVVAESAVVAEPAGVPARIAAAPVAAAPVVAAARYAVAAPVGAAPAFAPARFTTAFTAPLSRYATAPFARLAAAPFGYPAAAAQVVAV